MEKVALANSDVEAIFLPAIGGKLASFKDRKTGREWLLAPPEPARGYGGATRGAPFEDFDTSGFDECFPTVSECRYPEAPFAGALMPDHGELWSVPWSCTQDGDTLRMAVEGGALPYRFERSARLDGRALALRYTLTSTGTAPFHYLWSSHPLLAAEPGARIHLPPEARELYLNWSRDDRLGQPGDTVAWSEDLSTIGERTRGYADKLFTGRLERGLAALYSPSTDSSLELHFDPSELPYVGLWICQGG